MISAFLLAFLAMKAGQMPPASQIMEQAVRQSIIDTKTLKEKYIFEVVKTPPSPPRCDNPADSQVTIPDLFGPDRFAYTLDDTIELNGRLAYVVSFLPKDKQAKSVDTASFCMQVRDQSLNHLRGLVYVDTQSFGVARVVTHVYNPPAHIKGVGRLYTMEVTIEQFRLGTIWAPREVTIDSDYSYLPGIFSKHHPERTTFVFRNFRLKGPDSTF